MSTKVALVGATGNLGPAILKPLLDSGFQVVVLSRKGSKSTDSLKPHSNQEIIQAGYDSVQELTSALTGVNTVVSNLPPDATEAHKKLINASVAAGVKRYLASEFGSDIDNPSNRDLPVFAPKVEIRKYVEKAASANPSFTYTYVINNAFFDWGLQVGFIANVKNHSATLYDGGDVIFSTTTLSTVGKAVVGVIKNQDATANRAVYIHDTAISINKIIELAKSIDGKDWTAETANTEEIVKESYKELGKPSPGVTKAIYGFLFKAAFGAASTPDFTGRIDNKLLGLEEMSKDQIKEVIKAAM